MKKNKLILLQLFIAFTLICTSVYAAVDTTISVSASSTDVKKGDEITVTLALDKVDANKKVESVEGYINYNKDIFEKVTADNIEKTSDNTVKIGDEELPVEDLTNKTEVTNSDAYVAFNGSPSSENDIKLVVDFKNGITKNTELLKMKFKVKADAKLGTVTNAISYEMFQITAGNETGGDITKNINVTVVSDEEQPKPEHEHKWKENTSKGKSATCTEDGYKFFECTEEGCTETKKETIKATGHKFGDWKVTKEATTTAEGEKQRECSVCKKVETEKIAKKTDNTNKNTNKNTNTNNTNTNKANTNKTNTNTNTDNTVAGSKIPATGSKVYVMPAILLIVLAYISYNKYMKYKDI